MADTTNFRKERIEKLLYELRYEITRAVMEGDAPEKFGYRFVIANSNELPGGVVACEFRARPTRMPPDPSWLEAEMSGGW